MAAIFAHLYGESDAIKHTHCCLVFAVLYVGVALAANGNVIHRRHGNYFRPFLGQIEFPVFLLVVECHNGFSRCSALICNSVFQ